MTSGTLINLDTTIRNEAGTANQQINLSNYSLWKLSYNVVKSYTNDSITLSDGTTLNFNRAAAGWAEAAAVVGTMDLDEDGAWISIAVPSSVYHQPTSVGYDLTAAFNRKYTAGSPKGVTIGSKVSGTMYGATVTRNDDTTVSLSAVSCATPYNDGWNECLTACGISGGGTVYTGSVRQLYDPSLDVWVNCLSPYYSHYVGAK